jgi:hypothetical protein
LTFSYCSKKEVRAFQPARALLSLNAPVRSHSADWTYTVSYPLRRKAADQVLIQLIEADVDIGFGLVDEARAYHLSGRPEFCSRALQEATEIVVDIERRLQQIGDAESTPFLPLVAELRNEIASAAPEKS